MARVTGPSRKELDARGDEFAARVSRAIHTTLRDVAANTRDVDDLTRIQGIWRIVVGKALAPRLRIAWDTAVQGVVAQLEKINTREQAALVAAVFEIPKVSNPLAESFLADAQNRLVAIGDVVWYTARGEMLTGLQLGEGVAELKQRVIASAAVSSKRAEVIARTEVNSAMNNGAYEQMKALDVDTVKEWIATDDARTRESHAEVDGEEIDGEAKFMVGGFPMDHPHDLNAPPSETINCRCTLAWEIIDDEDDYEDELVAAGVKCNSFHLLGKHDQSDHGRDKPDKPDAPKKPTSFKPGKKINISSSWPFKKHQVGVVAITKDDNDRILWTGNAFDVQSRNPSTGEFKTHSTIKKSKLHSEMGGPGALDWFEPVGVEGDSSTDESNAAAKPSYDFGDDVVSTPEGKPLKITHGLVHKKHEPGEVIAINGAQDKRVVWDGAEYRLQRTKMSGGSWTTEKSVKKSKAYVEINAYDSDWREPTNSSGENDVTQPGVAVKPDSSAKPSPSKPGDSLAITHDLVNADYEIGDIIAENDDASKRVIWDGDYYRLQRKDASKGTWVTEVVTEKAEAYDEITKFDSDWRVPKHKDIATAKAATASTPTPAVELKSMDDLTKVGPHKKGALFKDNAGVTWAVTPAQSESHARNQFLAANLYSFTGVSVESTDIVEIDPAKFPNTTATVGVKTLHAPGTTGVVEAMKNSASTRQAVNENFAIDAWLGNWDVVGLGYENLAVNKSGHVRRTNIGGSLLYRANGTPKGNAFSDTVTEIDSLRNPHVNPASAKVFADVTDDDIRAGVAKLEKLSPATIDFVVEKSGFTGDEAAKLKKTLKARRQDLIDKYGSNAPKPAATPNTPATSTQPTATSALGGGVKKYTYAQKAKVQSIFAKHNVKWFNKTNAIYDAAHEVSTTHSDLTMADALDIMDQSLKKKTDNPFRTKTEKWLKTKAGKQHALSKGGSASLGGTAPATSPAPAPAPASAPTASPSQSSKYVDHGGALPKKLTRITAGILQQRMNEATPPPWTSTQRSALRTYTGGSYTQINKCARGTAPCDPSTKKTLDDINAAMKPSTDNVVVYRKTNPASFGVTSGEDLKDMVGKTISDNGVISTSIKSNMWTGQLNLEIEAPKGSMMAWVQPISLHPSEDEMIVAPGTHYEVIEVSPPTYSGGPYQIKLRIIPGSDTKSREQAEKLKTQEAIAALKAQKEQEAKEEEKKNNLDKQKIDDLVSAYNQGYVVEKSFTEGNSSSKTELLLLANGTRVVRKSGGKQILSGKPDTRFEYLGGRVWNALGGTNVHTAQVDDSTVITTYVEGDMGGKLLNNTFKSGNTNQENKKAHKEETLRQMQLAGGKEIGLLDYLIANQDRHSLNWIVGPNNDQVHPIDQGGAVFIPSTHMEDGVPHTAYVASEFSDYWLGIKASWYVKSMKPKFTKAELAQYRTNLEAIKDEFAAGEETEWYNSMMSRLAEVESKVKK